MNDFEDALAGMLADRAGRIEPRPRHREATMRGARRRRLLAAATAAFVPLVVAVGAFAAIQDRDTAPAPRPAAPDERSAPAYSFTSRAGEYPIVATGTFRDAEWQLRAAAATPGQDSSVRMAVDVELPFRRLTTLPERVSLEEHLFVRYESYSWLLDGDTAVVFGAVDPEAETVDVWTTSIERGERTFRAELFEGYDAKASLSADYFIVFIPMHRTGLVIAEDADGNEVGVQTIHQR